MRKRWAGWLIVLSIGLPVLGQAQTREERREAMRKARQDELLRRQQARGGAGGAASAQGGQGGTTAVAQGGTPAARGGTAGQAAGGRTGTGGGGAAAVATGGSAGRAGSGGATASGGTAGRAGAGGSAGASGKTNQDDKVAPLAADISVLRATRAARRLVTLQRLRERWGATIENPAARDELSRHARRVAELQRIRLLAEEKKRTALLENIDKLLTAEELRHSRAMNSLRDGALPAPAAPGKP